MSITIEDKDRVEGRRGAGMMFLPLICHANTQAIMQQCYNVRS
jgi:hypothetical protein